MQIKLNVVVVVVVVVTFSKIYVYGVHTTTSKISSLESVFEYISLGDRCLRFRVNRGPKRRTIKCFQNVNVFKWTCFTQLLFHQVVKGGTSRYFEMFFGPLKIVVNWKKTLK